MNCSEREARLVILAYREASTAAEIEIENHVALCPLCKSRLEALQRAREEVSSSIPEPPYDLHERILLKLDPKRARPAWLNTLDHGLAWAGGLAMRPQVVMGTLLLLMVGTSLLLLRARPAGPGSVRITEHGVPAAEPPTLVKPLSNATASVDRKLDLTPPKRDDDKAQGAKSEGKENRDKEPRTAPADQPTVTPEPARDTPPTDATREPTPAPAPTPTAPPQDDAFATAMEDFKAKHFADAVRNFDIVARGGGPQAPLAALYAARAERYSSGCGTAVNRFDAVSSRYPGASVAAEGMWEAAVCYRELGQAERAKQLFQTLRRVAGYKERADKELEKMEQKNK